MDPYRHTINTLIAPFKSNKIAFKRFLKKRITLRSIDNYKTITATIISYSRGMMQKRPDFNGNYSSKMHEEEVQIVMKKLHDDFQTESYLTQKENEVGISLQF